MFDIGWTEMLVVACVAIIVVGPKDLPKMLRTIGKTVGNLKRMASDFQGHFDEAIKEAELDDVKKLADGKLDPLEDIKKATSEFDTDFKKVMAERDAEFKAAAEKGEEVPLFPENETSKMLAEKRAKDLARVKAKEAKKASGTAKSKTASAKPAAKKAAPKAPTAKKTAPKTSVANKTASKPAAKKTTAKKTTKPKAAKGKAK